MFKKKVGILTMSIDYGTQAPPPNKILEAIRDPGNNCPNCTQPLKKRPARKTKCPHCGDFLFIRKGKLVTEAQRADIDLEEKKISLRLIGISDEEFDQVKSMLANKWGYDNNSEQIKGEKEHVELVEDATISMCQTRARLKSCKQYDNDLVEISDHHTNCEICKEFEGKVYSISGKNMTYPKLENIPPFHLGCRHGLFPTSEAAIEVRKREIL